MHMCKILPMLGTVIKKSEVDLIHDGSPHLQFDLMQVQAMAHLPAFAMVLYGLPVQGSNKA